jgi:alkylation response protein AidB-like acyl-CoA dehydrogenase
MMERQLDETLRSAQERKQGGRPIIDHRSVSNWLADMKVRHESARLLTYTTALHVLRGELATTSAALSKLVASENALASSLDATFNYGAVGYLSEFQIERNLRDAVGGLIYSGTSDIQRNIIVSVLRSDDRRRRTNKP